MNKHIFKLFYKKIIFLSLIVVTFFIFGCASNLTGNVINVPNETSKAAEVYFCPEDDCGKVIENRINNANSSVHCALYDIDLKNVINALAKKSKNIDVKVVMDNSNNQSQIKGDAVELDDGNQLMHNKFCVIDNKIVITGSFNPTYNDNYKNNNNVAVIYSNALSGNYEDEFEELWEGKFGKGNGVKYPIVYVNEIKIENYFCPEDDCASHIAGLIKNANRNVYFMSFSFTNKEIADALIAKRGLDIKGIVDSGQSSGKFSQLKRLQDFAINVKKDNNKYKMHHKVFVIDNETVATGSFNPTSSADTKNDENIVIIHDKKIAGSFLKEFDRLWS